VPDLDDKRGVLRRRLEEFDWKLDLGLDGDPPHTVIHRCESVLHFNQAIFVLDSPKSRLASEYKSLVWELIAHNPADRDGALLVLIGCHKYLTLMVREAKQGKLKENLLSGGEANVRFLATVKGVRGHKRVTVPAWGRYLRGDPLLDQIACRFPDDAEIQEHIGRCRKAVERFRTVWAARCATQGNETEHKNNKR
jgi:hypothetical protein